MGPDRHDERPRERCVKRRRRGDSCGGVKDELLRPLHDGRRICFRQLCADRSRQRQEDATLARLAYGLWLNLNR